MAIVITRTKEVKTVKFIPNGVTLELSHEETRVLKIVLSKVGGSPSTTLRGYISNISDALDDAGYRYKSADMAAVEPAYGERNSIYFNDGELLGMEPTNNLVPFYRW